jgi:hypothetical protein
MKCSYWLWPFGCITLKFALNDFSEMIRAVPAGPGPACAQHPGAAHPAPLPSQLFQVQQNCGYRWHGPARSILESAAQLGSQRPQADNPAPPPPLFNSSVSYRAQIPEFSFAISTYSHESESEWRSTRQLVTAGPGLQHWRHPRSVHTSRGQGKRGTQMAVPS